MAFKKGTSGNPTGRPRSRAKIEPLRLALYDVVPEIIDTLVASAKAGDTTASKLILERVLPALKSQSLPVQLPIADNLADQGSEIIKAIMAGQIPPDIGSQLITALAAQGRLIELEEISERLQKIEKVLEQRSL